MNQNKYLYFIVGRLDSIDLEWNVVVFYNINKRLAYFLSNQESSHIYQHCSQALVEVIWVSYLLP